MSEQAKDKSHSLETMRVSLNKDSSIGSALSESRLFGCSSWENSTDSHAQQESSISKGLSLKMGVSEHDSHNTKLLCFQFQAQDSSSTQSTGQSDSEVISMRGANFYGQGLVSTQSGHDETSGKLMGGQTKQVSSMGAQEFVFSSQFDCGQVQPIAHIPFHYAEPYFGGLLAAATFGPQAMIHHSQVVGVSPGRVPLPLDHLTEDEPIYVNAKQYSAILRRRQSRAKLEAQNKLVKVRKPYLHESRHLHALKRARGSGGRFLTAKDVQGSKDGSGSTQLHLPRANTESEPHHHHNHNHHRPENNNDNKNKDGSSTTSCSEVTSGSNSDDMFHQLEFRFSGYPVHGRTADSLGGGPRHHHVSAHQ